MALDAAWLDAKEQVRQAVDIVDLVGSYLQLRHQGRSLLFDLGDGARLPARLAHQVTDVFISHAHMDHISGFQWLLRSRWADENQLRVRQIIDPIFVPNS